MSPTPRQPRQPHHPVRLLAGIFLWLVVGYSLIACNTLSGQPVPEQFMVLSAPNEPDTLDAHKTVSIQASDVMDFIGASLVVLDAQGKIAPYLAERWEISEDGLTYTFHLKEGITFHDGTPFTAQDYVYTFNRAREPEMGGVTGDFLGAVVSAQAPNATTLVITLEKPFFPFLYNLVYAGYMMPLSQTYVEQQGEAYGRHPMSVGPYRFKEWREDGTIVLERNTDFHWGPAYAPDGPTLDRVEFRVIPDPSDQLAALERGEIDLLRLDPQHMQQAQPLLANYEVHRYVLTGSNPIGVLNVSQPPFDDLRVRQAFNLAVDREAILQTVLRGEGEIQHGPLSSSVIGYWPDVEELGYPYDPERAEALLAEAGYVQGADGFLERDGQPLEVIFLTESSILTDLLKDQFAELGARVEIPSPELQAELFSAGEYHLFVTGVELAEADLLYLFYHSTDHLFPFGPQGDDADTALDEILEKTRTTMDPEERQVWVNRAQQHIVEQAYVMPLHAPRRLLLVNKQIEGFQIRSDGGYLHEGAHRVTLRVP